MQRFDVWSSKVCAQGHAQHVTLGLETLQLHGFSIQTQMQPFLQALSKIKKFGSNILSILYAKILA